MKRLEIILSTKNQSKALQIRNVLSGLSVEILTLSDARIVGEAVEDGETLEDNALKKALFAWRSGRWAMADDTGLFIDVLDGMPGVRSARWAGESASTEEIMRFTLKKLERVPFNKRTGHFKTVAVLVSPDGSIHTFSGMVEGYILTEPRVPCQPKMPYSAIFVPFGQPKAWAEMTITEENAISHRGKAFRQVREFLLEKLSCV